MLHILYWMQESMSFSLRVVSIPAHLPTWLSYPSAATMHLARISISSPMLLALIPTIFPPSRMTPVHEVLSMIWAPASAASLARALSKRCLSRTYPTSDPALDSSSWNVVPWGDLMIAPFMSPRIQVGSGSIPTSSSHFLETPSAHLRGAPISAFFSISMVFRPPWAQYLAAMLPPGPAPTTTMSHSYVFMGDHSRESAATGQSLTQMPHLMQSSLNSRTKSFRNMAFLGQEPTHPPQWRHLFTSTFIHITPLP